MNRKHGKHLPHSLAYTMIYYIFYFSFHFFLIVSKCNRGATFSVYLPFSFTKWMHLACYTWFKSNYFSVQSDNLICLYYEVNKIFLGSVFIWGLNVLH